MEQPLIDRAQPGVAAAYRWSPGIVQVLLLSYFGLFGAMVGTHGVLWAPIVAALRLSEGEFGTALLASPLVAVGILLSGGRLTTWLGKKRMAIAGLLVIALTQWGLAVAGELWSFVAVLALGGLGNGLLEGAMNSAALDWEQSTRRSTMNLMHAAFSGGAVAGALTTGVLLNNGLTYGQILLLLVVLCGITLLATLPVRYPPIESSGETDGSGIIATLAFMLRRHGLLVLAILCLLGVAGEAVAHSWLVLYLTDLEAGLLISGAAFALFNAAMFLGRLANAPLVARTGTRTSLIASSVGIVVAAALLLVPNSVLLATIAFIVLGLAVAGMVPTVLVAAAEIAPGNSAAITGGIMAAAYLGFIVFPPVIGWSAAAFGLHTAIVVTIGVLGVGSLWLVRGVR